MKVKRLPVNTGTTGWNAVLPTQFVAAPLSDRVTADWLVIGAGFAGLAAARRLGQLNPDARIVLLEAARVGEGPAGRNSGFMIDLPHHLSSENYSGAAEQDRAQIAANRAAIAFALDAAREYGLPSEAIKLSGKVNAAASDRGLAHNTAYGAHLESLGEAHEFLDCAEMKALTGSAYYKGGLYTPGTAMLQPAMFVRGVAAGLRSNRIEIHENSPVTSLSRVGSDWCASTPKGAVTAPRVVLGVNGHAESFGQFARRLVHVHLFASMTRALTEAEVADLGGEATWGLTPADPMGTTVRRTSGTGGNRIIVRNRCHYTPRISANDRQLTDAAQSHDQSFEARFPMLKDVTMEHRWAGALCLSLNDAPAWGETEPGLFAACCQNGLGIARGTLSGIAIAEQASGHESFLTTHFTEAPQPRRLPPEPIAAIGATARIKWGEWKAGAEM